MEESKTLFNELQSIKETKISYSPDITIMKDIELEMYNRMIEIFKFNNFYALPRSFEDNALLFDNITDLPRGRVSFGNYDDNLTDNVTLLQPVDYIKDTKKYNYGKIDFEILSSELLEKIIYIDNIVIYAINTITSKIEILTVKYFKPEFVKEDGVKLFNTVEIDYRMNFHPFNGKYGLL